MTPQDSLKEDISMREEIPHGQVIPSNKRFLQQVDTQETFFDVLAKSSNINRHQTKLMERLLTHNYASSPNKQAIQMSYLYKSSQAPKPLLKACA
jgi:hypothetical protein